MRKFSSHAAVFALAATLLAGCGQVDMLKAKMAFKDANTAYGQQDYAAAAEKYEEVIALANDDPRLTTAYFFLGNSYDQMYRPTKRGEAANDGYLTKAIDNYKAAAEKVEDPKWKQLSLQYLVAAYTDKLQDPSQAEPVLQRMIEMDPQDPGNYNVLAKIYEDNGDYERAEQTLVKAREMKPNDPAVYMQLAGFYQRQGDFDKMIDAVQTRTEKEQQNPEAFYTLSTFYWEKASRDFKLNDTQKLEFAQKGIDAADKALALKQDYPEALTYKGLLLRVQANAEKNPARQQALLRDADEYSKQAAEIRNKQRSGA